MGTYIDLNSGEEFDETEVVFMNIYEVMRAVDSPLREDATATTYNGAIDADEVTAADIAVHQSNRLPNLKPFTLFDGVYWECEKS